jgi:hypothetical protein
MLMIESPAQPSHVSPPVVPHRPQPISEPTPTGILPILKENSISKPNRKVSFSPTMSKDQAIEQDVFDLCGGIRALSHERA